MIVIFEQDVRKHDGRRFSWRPGVFRTTFHGRRSWRVWWGLWSVSIYGSPGLREFMDYVSQGNTEWRER